jgi:hypothetical protein
MRKWVGREMAAFSALVIAAAALIADHGDAPAQNRQSATPAQTAPQKQFFPVKQMPLTEKLIEGYIAAEGEIDEVTQNTGEDIDKLSPPTIAKLDAIAKEHGISSYDQYHQIAENIGLVWSGLDDVTRKYFGREQLIRLRIARVKADKKMSADDKKERLTDLNDQLQFALPSVQYKGNIDLVVKYYDRLGPRGD